MVVLFNTHKYYKELLNNGFPESQADALTKANEAVFQEAVEQKLATKEDIQEVCDEIQDVKTELGNRIHKVESKMGIMQWMLGFLLASNTAIFYLLFRYLIP